MMDGAPVREDGSDEKLATTIDVPIAKCQAITQAFQKSTEFPTPLEAA